MASFRFNTLSLTLLYTIFLHSTSVSAQTTVNGITFLFPTPGKSVYVGDTVNVTWTSGFPKPKLFTFCLDRKDEKNIKQKEFRDVEPFNGSYLAVLPYTDVTLCWFNLRPNMTAGFGHNSPNVKLLLGKKSTTTIGLESPPNAASPTSTSTPPPRTTPTPLPDKGLSTGAKAGLGVGVSAVAISFIALLFYLRRRKYASVKSAPSPVEKDSSSSTPPGGYEHLSQGQAVSEMDSAERGWKKGGVGVEQVPELPARDGKQHGVVHELGGEGRPAEVEGSMVGR